MSGETPEASSGEALGKTSGRTSEGDSATLEATVRKSARARLLDRGVGYLSRREHSAHELREKLGRKDEFDLADEVVQQLVDQGLQSDARFAEQIGRVRTGSGKGPVSLKHELQKHRIASELIESVMATYEDSWGEFAEQVRVRKFGEAVPADYKEWARQARFLQQRGFNASHIRRSDRD